MSRDEIPEGFIHDQYGYCYYTVEKDHALIYNLYVEPEYRKQGHAKRLLRYVIAEIRKTGYTGEIQIEARPRENSIAVEKLVSFYQEEGLFVITDVEGNNEPEDVSSQLESLIIQRDALLSVMKELRESAEYWSEYDVPVGIVERMDQAIKIAEA